MNNMGENKCVACGNSIPEGRMICYECEYPPEPSFDIAKMTVVLNGIRDVSKFAHLSSKCTFDVIVKSGRFCINAKSMMGLLSLDLTKPLNVEFYGYISDEVREGMKKFIIG